MPKAIYSLIRQINGCYYDRKPHDRSETMLPNGGSTVVLNQSQALPVLGALLHGSCIPNHRFGQLLKAPAPTVCVAFGCHIAEGFRREQAPALQYVSSASQFDDRYLEISKLPRSLGAVSL